MKIEDLSELQLYYNMLKANYKDKKDINLNDYQKLIELFKKDFNITTDTHQLNLLFSPTIEEEIKDLRSLYNNIF